MTNCAEEGIVSCCLQVPSLSISCLPNYRFVSVKLQVVFWGFLREFQKYLLVRVTGYIIDIRSSKDATFQY